MKRILFVFLLVATSVCQSHLGSDAAAHIQHIEDGLVPAIVIKGEQPRLMQLADRMQRLNVPGVGVAVIHHGRIEWAQGFGVTRLGGTPVTSETLFEAGSISKPVAAMAALKLVEMGRLSLDTDVNTYLTSWKVPENEFTREKKVTLRGILTHSAGLTVHGFPGYARDAELPTLVQVLNGEKPANTAPIRVDTKPGTIWRYSGGGYTIMQQMMVDVMHKPFPEIMSELVLKPLGMDHSTYEQPLPPAQLEHAATPYYPQLRPVPGGPHTYPEMAAAGLWTTASDLAKLAISIQEGLAGKTHPVLSREMLRQMTSRQFGDWGLGWGIRGEGDKLTFGHGGVDEGFDALLTVYADRGEGAAIMTNANGGTNLANELMRGIAHEYGWPDPKPEERTAILLDVKALERFTGTYDLGKDLNINFSVRNGRLWASTAAAGDTDLFASTPTKFFSIYLNASYEFTPGENNAMKLIVTYPGGEAKGARVQSTAAGQ